jgi:hypothetical protein
LWRLARPFLDEVHEAFAKELRGFTQGRSRLLRALDIGRGMGDGAITQILLLVALSRRANRADERPL